MIRPAEAAHVATPVTITCGKIQRQRIVEPTTFDQSGRTIKSIRLLQAVEREQRLELTIESLVDEISNNPKMAILLFFNL